MTNWIKVCAVSEFPEKVKVIQHENTTIAVFHLPDGFYAIEDLCSHAEVPLSGGTVCNDCEIECPLHGARFNIKTGEDLSPPAYEPIATFPTKVEDDVVWVDASY